MKKLIPPDAILIPDDAEHAYKGVMFDVYHWQQKLYDGTFTTFEMLKRVDTVQIIAVKDSKLVLIDEQQIRHSTNRRFPTGKVDSGEAWETAAKRELREETGYQFANWKLIQVRQPFDQMEWFIATYLATDCIKEGKPELEGGEKSTRFLADFKDVKTQIEAGRDDLKHSYTLFHPLNSIEDLLALPAFQGIEVER